MNINSLTDRLLSTVKSVWKYWKDLAKSTKIKVIVISIVVLTISGILVFTLNHTTYAVLYTNLSSKDAGDILTKLSELKIDAKAQGSDTIVVPESEVDLIRMQLASEGYPKSSTNLDILGQGSGFGVTEEDKAVYRKYQLQEDLQNSIKTFASIADARVTLYIPEESSFVIDSQSNQASAAALITLKDGCELSSGNVKAIAELIQRSVSGLTAENVSIIDSNMNVLSAEESTAELSGESQSTMEQQVSDRLKKQVIALLQPIFGIDKVLAQVSVTLNFDESVIDTIKFEPMENASTGIISTIDSIREATKANTDTEDTTTYPVTDTEDSVYESNTEKITYEINTIKEHLVKAKGSISKLSVSVIIDQASAKGIDYSESVKQLVATAVGVLPDYITVELLPFNGAEASEDSLTTYQQIANKVQQWKQIEFITVVGLCVIAFFIILILVFKRKRKTKQEEFEEKFPSLTQKGDIEEKLKEIDLKVNNKAEEINANYELEKTEKAIIEKYVESNPELVASIIRSWLADDEG